MSFPFKLRFREPCTTDWYDSHDNIRTSLVAHSCDEHQDLCYEMVKATWADEPVCSGDINDDEVERTFIDILEGRVLPNSMERIQFTFLIEGLTLVEVSHMLRHRVACSIHAQCTADRDLRADSAFIPSSIMNSQWSAEYMQLAEQCKDLYARMVDGVNEDDAKSDQISLLDARYILPRCTRQFYYFTFNLKDAIAFIHQRKCTQVQPELDNIIAHQMFELICAVIPQVRNVVSMKCDARCFYVKAPDKDNSRLYAPDKVHKEALKSICREDMETLYSKTRKEMGVWFNPQD